MAAQAQDTECVMAKSQEVLRSSSSGAASPCLTVPPVGVLPHMVCPVQGHQPCLQSSDTLNCAPEYVGQSTGSPIGSASEDRCTEEHIAIRGNGNQMLRSNSMSRHLHFGPQCMVMIHRVAHLSSNFTKMHLPLFLRVLWWRVQVSHLHTTHTLTGILPRVPPAQEVPRKLPQAQIFQTFDGKRLKVEVLVIWLSSAHQIMRATPVVAICF